jgi:DNA polymerase-3 subunit beta
LLSGVERLLTIGEFAEHCGLSRSALRFYDQNELLRPRLVDDETGYRYYAIGQLDRALLVRRLRGAEMPVGVLREYLEATPERREAILDAHLTSFRARASAVESAISDLRRELARIEDGEHAPSCSIAPTVFASALGQVSFAIADPEVRAELDAVWIETKEDSLRLVATDSYRLAVRDLVPERIGSIGVRGVIEAEPARGLIAELATATTLLFSQSADGRITAIVDGRRLDVGGAGEGFPDYERILLGLPVGEQIALPCEAIVRALSELPLESPHLRLEFEPDRLVLQAAGRRTGVPGSWSGPALTMFVDRRFFAEAVTAMVGPDLVIEALDPLRPVTLRSADTGTLAVLTMPIRPTDAEPPDHGPPDPE